MWDTSVWLISHQPPRIWSLWKFYSLTKRPSFVGPLCTSPIMWAGCGFKPNWIPGHLVSVRCFLIWTTKLHTNLNWKKLLFVESLPSIRHVTCPKNTTRSQRTIEIGKAMLSMLVCMYENISCNNIHPYTTNKLATWYIASKCVYHVQIHFKYGYMMVYARPNRKWWYTKICKRPLPKVNAKPIFQLFASFCGEPPHKATVESSETNLTFRQWLVGAPRWWFHLETQYDREI